ncbi:Ig-like domain-containing protein [Psychrobacter immobilis]|uniref:Ig-like domain-containing protein n=1 Tax=Psychrobacter immobilis TaxID=498 RepID=UPI001918A022|nr:Ig-like domain-containing protein [Psychrobacter immobilis]
MNTIIVKTNDATQTIDQVQVVTKDGKPTIIKAMDKVNYEFHDTAIGRAPNHIITKRLKNDLHVSFEEEGQESDLIIQGFYDNPDSALLGIAEDGEYYYYIPDTGETYDYVTQLKVGDVEGQALGGTEYVAIVPWWIPAAAGVGLVGIVAASSSSSNDSGGDVIPPVYQAPVANNDEVTTESGTPVTKDIIGNDTDPNDDPLTVDDFTVDGTTYQPGETATITGVGTITMTPEGELTFTPEPNYAGPVPDVTYTVTDGQDTDTGTVTFIDVPNAPPVANNDEVTTESGTPVTKDIIGNDTDPNDDPLTVDDFTVDGTTYQPGETATITGVGTITMTPEGELTFTPEPNYAGPVPDVTYTVTDGQDTDTGTVTFIDVPNAPPVANNDDQSMEEDSGTTTGNVLTNDVSGLTVTGIQIGGADYTVGTSIDIPDVGSVQIDANGDYSFTPVEDYSGDVPTITYTVSDGTTTDTADLNIEVIAVADKPTAGAFELDPPALSLNIQTWSNAQNINGENLLENGGDGAAKETLLNAIDYLRSNENVTNSNGSAVSTSGSGTTTSLSSTNLPAYDAVYISGYVFLEVGQTYTYSGIGDDSAAIVIGDDVSSLHVNWRGANTSGEDDFSVTETGFYSFQFYAHNADGPGNYDFAVANTDGSSMKYYPNADAIEDSLKETRYVLGGYDAGSDGKDDTGFFPVNIGYEGLSSDTIDLTGIHLQATDIDGSEYLSFEVSGLPAGAMLSFTDASGTNHSVTVGADGIANYTPAVGDTGTNEYKDFKLVVGDDTTAASLDVTFIVTSTEKSNGDSSSSTIEFEVQVTDNIGNDTIEFSADKVSMDGGAGFDTLLVDTSIDFSSFDSNKIDNMELIELGDGAQSLTNLKTSDVINMTDSNDTIFVDGDTADSVQLSGNDWTNTNNTTTQNGNTYDIYSFSDSNGTHNVMIDTDITTTII